MRGKVLVQETAKSVLQTLSPAAQKAHVVKATEGVVRDFLLRRGAFGQLPEARRPYPSKQLNELAEVLRVGVGKAMGSDAPYGLSLGARKLFLERLQVTLGSRDPLADLGKEKRAIEAKLRPPPPPPKPLTKADIAEIDAIYRHQIMVERKINNHSPQHMKRWMEEEARRRRRKLLARESGRAFLRKSR
jgi:hypothetical protein